MSELVDQYGRPLTPSPMKDLEQKICARWAEKGIRDELRWAEVRRLLDLRQSCGISTLGKVVIRKSPIFKEKK